MNRFPNNFQNHLLIKAKYYSELAELRQLIHDQVSTTINTTDYHIIKICLKTYDDNNLYRRELVKYRMIYTVLKRELEACNFTSSYYIDSKNMKFILNIYVY